MCVWCVYACVHAADYAAAGVAPRRPGRHVGGGQGACVCACVVRVCVHAADGAVVCVAPWRPGRHVGGGQGACVCVCGACMHVPC